MTSRKPYDRIDWQAERDRIDLADVATGYSAQLPDAPGSVVAGCGGVAHSTRITTRPSQSSQASRSGSVTVAASRGTRQPS